MDYAIVAAVGIPVWPTTLVVMPDGKERTRLTGPPQTFSRDLGAYLAFATGKIDRRTLDKQLTQTDVVAGSQSQQAARHLLVAQRLMKKGLADQGADELAAVEKLEKTPLPGERVATIKGVAGVVRGEDAIMQGTLRAKCTSKEMQARPVHRQAGGYNYKERAALAVPIVSMGFHRQEGCRMAKRMRRLHPTVPGRRARRKPRRMAQPLWARWRGTQTPESSDQTKRPDDS